MRLSTTLIFGMIVLTTSCRERQKPLVIGHRGAMGHVMENTLASVQKALDMDVDMIEIDVFRITSGEIVVFHDERLNKLSNGKGRIEAYSWEALQQITLKGNHKIPLLTEVLELVDGQVRLNIELKGSQTAEGVNALVNHYIGKGKWKLEDFIISSFKWEELEKMRAINPKIPIAVLTEGDPLNAISKARSLNAEAINPYFKRLDLEKVNAIHEAGFKIYTWTVNEPNAIRRAKRWAVDGIITNYPERVE